MKRPTPARREYTPERSARIGWCAGAGWTHDEIAREFGFSRQHVYDVSVRYKIPFCRKDANETAFTIVLNKQCLEQAKELAKPSGADPYQLMGRLLEAVLAEPTVARNLLDETSGENTP